MKAPLDSLPKVLDGSNDAAKRIVNELGIECLSLFGGSNDSEPFQKPRISIEAAWNKINYTYGLMGPTVVPIILHFIRQQHLLEDKYANNPAALQCFTFMMVSKFHEQIMPFLCRQINVTHSWILHTLEEPYIRSYLNLV